MSDTRLKVDIFSRVVFDNRTTVLDSVDSLCAVGRTHASTYSDAIGHRILLRTIWDITTEYEMNLAHWSPSVGGVIETVLSGVGASGEDKGE